MAIAPEAYFNQQFDQIQQNQDPFAAAEQLKRLQRLGDYMAAQNLPPQARLAVENQINSQPGFQGSTWQAQRQLNDLQALHPNASQQQIAAHFVNPWALAAAHPAAAPVPQQQAQQQAAVGVGEVNGQPAFYPYAGNRAAYQTEMGRLGLNPGEINVPQDGLTLQDYMNAATGREIDTKRRMAEADAKVLAAHEAAQGRILSQQLQNDGNYRVQVLKNDGTVATHLMDAQGRILVANVTQEGLNQRNASNQDRLDRRANERNLTTTNNTRAKVGLPAVSELPGQQHGGFLQNAMSAAAGLFPQIPQLVPGPPAVGAGVSPVEAATASLNPAVQHMIGQLPPQARAKLDRVDMARFASLSPQMQQAFLLHLISGK